MKYLNLMALLAKALSAGLMVGVLIDELLQSYKRKREENEEC